MKKNSETLRAIKFVLFSISAGVIELGTFTILYEVLHWDYWVSYLIAFTLSVLWNFTLNRKFTFKSAANVPVAMLKVLAYNVVFLAITTWSGEYLAETLKWNEYLVTALNMALNLITEYLFQRFVVYGKNVDNAEK